MTISYVSVLGLVRKLLITDTNSCCLRASQSLGGNITPPPEAWYMNYMKSRKSIFVAGKYLERKESYIQSNMFIRASKRIAFSVKNSMTEGKRKLEWHRVRKYICFLILFIPGPGIVKIPFFRIFRNFVTQHFLCIYIIFHILTQPKNLWKKLL